MWTCIDYQIDFLLFAACCVGGLMTLRRWLQRRRRDGMAFDTCLVLSMLVLVAGYFCLCSVDREQRDNLINHMNAFASTYAGELEKLGHSNVPDDVDPETSDYQRLEDAQRRWLEANSFLSDIYTLRRSTSGRTVLVVDSATDYNRNGIIDDPREERTTPGEEYIGFSDPVAASAVSQAFDGYPSFISEPYTDRWGTWVTALHPMLNSDDDVEAIVGVDFPAAVWGRQIFNARLSVIGILAVMESLLLGASAMIAMTRFHLSEQQIAANRLQQFKTTLDQTLDSVFMFSTDNYQCIYVNEGAKQLLGYSEEALLQQTALQIAPKMAAETFAELTSALQSGTHQLFTLETFHRHSHGHDIPVELSLQYVSQSTDRPRFVAIVRDITERRAIEKELMIAARLDRLTGLPNRALFTDRLKQFMERTRKIPGYKFALMFLDFDRFKIVNDSLGHDVGDALLQEIASRLKNNLSTTDSISTLADGTTVSRLGGDEFVVILDDIDGLETACKAANALIAALGEQYQLGDHQVRSTASIGIVCSSPEYERAEDMVRDADTAMYEAKARGKACYVVYDNSMRVAADRRLQTENDLRMAIGTDQIFLDWQPVISLEDGELNGAEALIRWRHPTRGVMNPDLFLPIAEETRMILPISDWVLNAACDQFVRWRAESPTEAPRYVCVNLAYQQLMQPDLAVRVLSVLREHRMQPEQLQLEVKESELMKNRVVAGATLHALATHGIRLAIDDFGTGYSSLACLQEFPFSVLKMDRSFIANLNEGHEVIAVAHSVVTLADNIGISCVAEGIEDPVQLAVLQSMNCSYGQGNFLCPPGPADNIRKKQWLRSHHAASDMLMSDTELQEFSLLTIT